MKRNYTLSTLILTTLFCLLTAFAYGATQPKTIKKSDVKKIFKANSSFFEGRKTRKGTGKHRNRHSLKHSLKGIEFQIPSRFQKKSTHSSKRKSHTLFQTAKDYIRNGKLYNEKAYLIAKRGSGKKSKPRTPPSKWAQAYLKEGKLRSENPFRVFKRGRKRGNKPPTSLFKVVRNYQKSGKLKTAISRIKSKGRSKK